MIIEEPADAVFEEFPCWCCGGETEPTYLVTLNPDGSVVRHRRATRMCGSCQVTELRRAVRRYIPATRSKKVTPDGDPYIDHSVSCIPSPG
jgi:hypothetical protein